MSGLFHRRPHAGSAPGIVPGSQQGDATAGTSSGRSDWRGYDDVAEAFERVQAPRTALVAADLVALAAPPKGGRVLDVGAGTGVGIVAAQDVLGPKGLAVGVDASLEMLRVGLTARPGIRVAAAQAIDLPFRDAAFDAATANFVIAHFTRYETALFDMIRVLKPGGRLAVSAWGEAEDEFQRTWRLLVEESVPHEMLEDALRRAMPWEERFRDRHRLEEALRDAGLRPVEVQPREYRFHMSRDDYLAGREVTTSGRFVRDMLGPGAWESLLGRAKQTFAERFPDPLTDFRDVLLAVGTKPESWVGPDEQTRR